MPEKQQETKQQKPPKKGFWNGVKNFLKNFSVELGCAVVFGLAFSFAPGIGTAIGALLGAVVGVIAATAAKKGIAYFGSENNPSNTPTADKQQEEIEMSELPQSSPSNTAGIHERLGLEVTLQSSPTTKLTEEPSLAATPKPAPGATPLDEAYLTANKAAGNHKQPSPLVTTSPLSNPAALPKLMPPGAARAA